VNAYGVQAFVDRASELASKYGEVFEPPQLLQDMAAQGTSFA
jgi:3-hydroxyacyl-CoA dehydrogenase/enoyl-CoA hydratase/3-hydroxybutyryl-CoA epimerase